MTAPATPKLHVTEVGSGRQLVVFCHGLFGQGKNWTSVAKGLANHCTSLLVDLPNHGQSPWTEEFSYPAMAAAVAETVAERSGGAPVALVGHSMGGKVAMTLALHHPELVERLCVVDIAPISYTGPSPFADFIRGMRSMDRATLASRAEAFERLAPDVPDPGVRSFLLQNLRREGEGWRWQPNLALLGDHLADMSAWPDDDVEPYTGPVLWVAGALSRYVRPEHADSMRAHFPRVVTVTVKNAGHWVHSEQPATFLSVLSRFLAASAA